MPETVDKWRPSWRWVWETRRLWLTGFTVLAFLQMALVVAFALGTETKLRRKAQGRSGILLTESMRVDLPVGELPRSRQGEALDEVIVSGVIQSYARARVQGNMVDAREAIQEMRRRRETAVRMLRNAIAGAKDRQCQAVFQEALAAME